VVLERLPLTSNGKVDHRALPPPRQAQYKNADHFIRACSPIEEILMEIWAEVLKLDRVSVNDNFFELGGHSIKAIQLINRLGTTFPIKISVRAVFEYPTVEQLAQEIEHRLTQELKTLPHEEV
jgi:acyl carrier protein